MWQVSPWPASRATGAARARTVVLIGAVINAAVQWADAEIRTGGPAAVLAPLTELAEQHPLVEPAAASARSPPRATPQKPEPVPSVRRRLVDELGVEPGAEVRAAHGRSCGRRESRRDLPAQLPLDVPDFVGRDANSSDCTTWSRPR